MAKDWTKNGRKRRTKENPQAAISFSHFLLFFNLYNGTFFFNFKSLLNVIKIFGHFALETVSGERKVFNFFLSSVMFCKKNFEIKTFPYQIDCFCLLFFVVTHCLYTLQNVMDKNKRN